MHHGPLFLKTLSRNLRGSRELGPTSAELTRLHMYAVFPRDILPQTNLLYSRNFLTDLSCRRRSKFKYAWWLFSLHSITKFVSQWTKIQRQRERERERERDGGYRMSRNRHTAQKMRSRCTQRKQLTTSPMNLTFSFDLWPSEPKVAVTSSTRLRVIRLLSIHHTVCNSPPPDSSWHPITTTDPRAWYELTVQ